MVSDDNDGVDLGEEDEIIEDKFFEQWSTNIR